MNRRRFLGLLGGGVGLTAAIPFIGWPSVPKTVPYVARARAVSTTSTAAVDLVTLFDWPANEPIRIEWNYRKTSMSAQPVTFGVKVNGTTITEAHRG